MHKCLVVGELNWSKTKRFRKRMWFQRWEIYLWRIISLIEAEHHENEHMFAFSFQLVIDLRNDTFMQETSVQIKSNWSYCQNI